MKKEIDVRGLSCPQPVLMVLNEIKTIEKGEFVIFSDTDTSKENVIRAIESQGWRVTDIKLEGQEYRISISKD